MSLQQHERSLARVADILRNDKPAALLIGAGCSVSAGIPSGSGFAHLIRERYTSVEADTYADCMDELQKPQQKDLIQEKINEADVNWAHVAIAQLIDHDFVDRILTTNFDPLVSRACALIGRFPAIYDYAVAPGVFNPGTVSNPSVFHLHGQSTGFVLKNSKSEMRELEDALPDLLTDTLQERPLVVVGYGGGDPVFRNLVDHEHFQHGLYWITYEQSDPADHVKNDLLDGCENTYFVRSSNADEFFIRLTRKLECFPPTYVEKPFSHQLDLLDSLTEFPSMSDETTEVDASGMYKDTASSGVSSPSLEGESGGDIMQDAEKMIQKAATRFEEGVQAKINRARKFFAQGRHDKIEEMWESCETDEQKDALRQQYSASLHQRANGEHIRIRESLDHDSLESLRDVEEMYKKVLEVNDGYTQAQRGLGLVCWDMVKAGADDPDALFNRAIEYFRSAADAEERGYEALHNWGAVLTEKARRSHGENALNLFAEASEKYRRALNFNPDDPSTLNNLGFSLYEQAKGVSDDDEALNLLESATEKYERALDVEPDRPLTFHNLGDAFHKKAQLSSDEENALNLLEKAVDSYKQALAISPRNATTLTNWGYTLLEKAKVGSDDASIELINEAIEKYRNALEIQPDLFQSLLGWGQALSEKARLKSGEEVEKLQEKAQEKIKEGLQIRNQE